VIEDTMSGLCYTATMTDKKSPRPKKPPLTDAERHQRFRDMAKEVEADGDPEEFERAFKAVTKPAKSRN
jgi:hypothetical protein